MALAAGARCAIALQLIALPLCAVQTACRRRSIDSSASTRWSTIPRRCMRCRSIRQLDAGRAWRCSSRFRCCCWVSSARLRYLSLEWLVNQVMGTRRRAGDRRHRPEGAFRSTRRTRWSMASGSRVRAATPFGPFINRNHFAGWMVMALPLVVGYSCARAGADVAPARSPWRGAIGCAGASTVEASRFLLVGFCALADGHGAGADRSRSGIASFAVAMAGCSPFVRMTTVHGARRSRLARRGLPRVFCSARSSGPAPTHTVGRFLVARTDSSGPGRVMAWQRHDCASSATFRWFGHRHSAPIGQAMLVYQTRRPARDVRAGAQRLPADLPRKAGARGRARARGRRAGARWQSAPSADRRHATSPLTRWVRAGAVAGLAGIAAQSLVEFSLQMPGNRCCSCCCSRSRCIARRSARPSSRSSRVATCRHRMRIAFDLDGVLADLHGAFAQTALRLFPELDPRRVRAPEVGASPPRRPKPVPAAESRPRRMPPMATCRLTARQIGRGLALPRRRRRLLGDAR